MCVNIFFYWVAISYPKAIVFYLRVFVYLYINCLFITYFVSAPKQAKQWLKSHPVDNLFLFSSLNIVFSNTCLKLLFPVKPDTVNTLLFDLTRTNKRYILKWQCLLYISANAKFKLYIYISEYIFYWAHLHHWVNYLQTIRSL